MYVPLVPIPTSTAAWMPLTETVIPWEPESRSATRPATWTKVNGIWLPSTGH